MPRLLAASTIALLAACSSGSGDSAVDAFTPAAYR